ncbi:MAG: hypothetical protein AM325_014745 [Candidatus Thorarchaeota archaeon SMTZ1-45]|nr:MAG: hypothetical protein AM325_16155 [Candidatus Thorarchaeota archaeon SMTZ1-45]
MILPGIIGYVVGKYMSRKLHAFALGILLGIVLGLIATYTFIPLLYPVYAGVLGQIGIPEFDSIGIMVLLPDFVVYSESVYMFTRSYVIDSVFLVTGALFAALGTWVGTTHRAGNTTALF